MAQVSAADLKGVFRFMQAAVAGTRDDPLPSPTLAALRELIPAEFAIYFEFRRADCAQPLALATSDLLEPSVDQEAMRAFGHQNPIRADGPWGPSDGALRLSDSIRRRDLEKLEFYHSVMVPGQIHDTLKVWLWSSPETVACVVLDRAETSFTRRDQDILGILHHHLIGLRERALSGWLPPTPDGIWLTAREAEVLTWAARGMSDQDVAKVLGTSPATVGKHLEHAFEKLGVHSRAEALALLTGSGRPS